MSKVVFDMSMSLDGFITAPNTNSEQPLGNGGEQLHEWAWGSDERNRRLMEDSAAGLGAVICGRRTYNDSVPFWGSHGPTGAARVPVFVVTHHAPTVSPTDGVYTFVTEGIEQALQRARAAAGARCVTIMGGANLGQQYIQAGLIDELSIHLVPVLFGGGKRLFDGFEPNTARLDALDAMYTESATHLRFRVSR